MPTPQIPEHPNRPAGDGVPEFALSAWIADGDRGEVELIVHTTTEPSQDRHASLALLYGLAIMSLDQQGVIAAEIDKLLAPGPMAESTACQNITLLIQQEENAQPI